MASRTRMRRINGKVVKVKFKAPNQAGQGADFMEGFKPDKRCFRCGGSGHWARECPHEHGTATDVPEEGEGLAPELVRPEDGGGDAAHHEAVTMRLAAEKEAKRLAEQLLEGDEDANMAAEGSGVAAAAAGGEAGAEQKPPGGGTFKAPQLVAGVGAGSDQVEQWIHGSTAQAGPKAQGRAFQSSELLKTFPIFLTTWSSDGSMVVQQQAAPAAQQEAFQSSKLLPEDMPPLPGNLADITLSVPSTQVKRWIHGSTGQAAPKPLKEAFQLSKLLPEDMPPLPDNPADVTDEQLRAVLSATFGHADFRHSQLQIIRSVLSGSSMLGILPTGAGKSLCYQMPALLLPGGCMCMQGEEVLNDLSRGAVKLLYIAPEKLLTPVVLDRLRRLPEISLVCVDEGHCVAEWGHSFRPAYYRLGHILNTVLKPKAVLALTATATRVTERCIAQVLGLPSEATIRDASMRDNLRLRVFHDNGATASGRAVNTLGHLLKKGELQDTEMIICYVAYQAQADETAANLKRAGIRALSYHAGKSMDERLSVQRQFSEGQARVVVATVAFGMGVDTASIGAVVHTTLPRSLEDYVQQAGRAGRDGREARCYLVLDDADYMKLRSLTFSNAVELSSVESFIHKVFRTTGDNAIAAGPMRFGVLPIIGTRKQLPYCPLVFTTTGDNATARGPMRFGILPIKDTQADLDIAEETMETVLSHLQGHDGCGYLAVLPTTSVHVDVYFHNTQPKVLAERSQVVAAILAIKPRVTKGAHRCHMAKLVEAAGMSSSQVGVTFS
eukprot:gene5332-12927_t